MKTTIRLATFAICAAMSAPAARAANEEFEAAKKAILGAQGCYLVDYSYTETEALLPDYKRDTRVYDVNNDKTVKEWIYAVPVSDRKVRLQHVLFATDFAGNVNEDALLKHQAEDWEYEANYWYEFVAPLQWKVRGPIAAGSWLRSVTNLDDGLRYQCAAPWKVEAGRSSWTCEKNYAPIPGRETRDMGRKDYQALERSTTIVAYGSSWLERQSNVKTVHKGDVKTPLAREIGKNWFIRLPDKECAVAKKWAESKQPFWALLRETWEEVLDGKGDFFERAVPGTSRYGRVRELEEKYGATVGRDPKARAAARKELLALIAQYRS